MVEAKLLRKKLKNGLIVDKWDLVTIIEKQQAEIKHLKELFGCDPAYFEPDAHPVKEPMMVLDGNRVYPAFKELTDGEIQEISHQYHYTYNPDYVGFARAILRKAQEK